MRIRRINIALVLAIIIAIVGIVLPGGIIDLQVRADDKEVNQVPADYYMAANMALSKNLSLKLSEEERIKLCTGEWESNIYKCSTNDTNEIAFNAIKKAELFCQSENICQFNEWYSYEAEAYKAVEATFNSYLAYFWVATLTKYDHSDTIILKVTEGGSVLEVKRMNPDGTSEEIYSITKE